MATMCTVQLSSGFTSNKCQGEQKTQTTSDAGILFASQMSERATSASPLHSPLLSLRHWRN